MDEKCKQAELPADLEQQFMSCNTPLSSREHWARNEIESLRQQLAELSKTWLSKETYKTLMQERQETLHELAKCERERDQFKEAVNSYMKAYDDCRAEHTNTHAKLVALEEETAPKWRRYERVCEQLASVTKERDELADAFTVIWVSQTTQERGQWDAKAIEKFDALLAKVGADKTAWDVKKHGTEPLLGDY